MATIVSLERIANELAKKLGLGKLKGGPIIDGRLTMKTGNQKRGLSLAYTKEGIGRSRIHESIALDHRLYEGKPNCASFDNLESAYVHSDSGKPMNMFYLTYNTSHLLSKVSRYLGINPLEKSDEFIKLLAQKAEKSLKEKRKEAVSLSVYIKEDLESSDKVIVDFLFKMFSTPWIK